jgi:hypothetical protein
MNEDEEETEMRQIEIECFVTSEPCDKCQTVELILVAVNEEQNCYCFKCFSDLYSRAVEARKRQVMDS